MDSSDSDITDTELDELTTTGVLLGSTSEEETGDTISQLGGHPVIQSKCPCYCADNASHG